MGFVGGACEATCHMVLVHVEVSPALTKSLWTLLYGMQRKSYHNTIWLVWSKKSSFGTAILKDDISLA